MIVRSLLRLGTWSCTNWNISKLGMPSFETCIYKYMYIWWTVVAALASKTNPIVFMSWKTKSWKKSVLQKVSYGKSLTQKVSRLGKPSLECCNHCHDLVAWSCNNVTVQDLSCQVLKEQCKISDLWLPSLDNHVQLYSCLGRPRAKIHNS